MHKRVILYLLLLSLLGCEAQTNVTMETKNPMLCNPENGICELPGSVDPLHQVNIHSDIKPIKVLYFTDPICSSCWGIEPQLRKLKLEYGHAIQIEYHMGGLLPDWSYNSGGISKPSDVAHHWDEVSAYYQMPIVGDVWLEDPLHSSYPPSIAFKAAQLQNEEKAIRFLRIIREMVFLQKKNITKWEFLKSAAELAELNVTQFQLDYEGQANTTFQEDLQLARRLGVRGFPTFLLTDTSGKSEIIYGFKPYSFFEKCLHNVNSNISKKTYSSTADSLFGYYPSLTLREFSELSGLSEETSLAQLKMLTHEKKLEMLITKNGNLWTSNKRKK